MTFVADQTALQTSDRDRSASLHVMSGGSDGSKSFVIRLPEREISFSAELSESSWRVYGHHPEDDRMLISEALGAFGYGHGLWAEKVSEVLFLQKGRRFFRTAHRWVNAEAQ